MKKKSLKKNAFLNSLRQVSTILFSMITFPYISRVIQASNYGKISFANSLVGYFSLIAAMGISNYAIREGAKIRDDKQKLEVFSNQIFTINLYTTISAYFLLFIVYIFWNKLHSYTELLLIQATLIFLTTIGVEWIYGIYEDYAYITYRSVIVQIVSLILIFLFVKTREDYLRYAFVLLLSSGGGFVFNFFHSRKYTNLKVVRNVNFRKHFLPMLILFSSSIMISIYVNSDITILGILKSAREVGIYTVSVKIYTIAKQILNSIVVVMLPRLSYLLGKNQVEKYQKSVNEIFQFLLIIILPIIVGLICESRNVIMLIAGNSYLAGVVSLQILSLTIGSAVIGSYFTTVVLLPNGKEKIILMITILSSLLNLILNLILIPFWGINGSAFTTFLAESLVAILSLIYSNRYVNINLLNLNFIQSLLSSLMIIICCYLVSLLMLNYIIDIVISVLLSVLVYMVCMIMLKNRFVINTMKKFLKK